ncbi:conserved exported hypothetical protein [Tenacibaculum litopenaei]|uniref:hypothetical protein n=1 Tax=Tenacibaculum litopenaei TaxID=396016 RepID=UPI0038957A6D
MKKLMFAAVLFMSSLGYAQQEVKIDIADALIMKTIDVSYEYYISDQSSVGLSALFNFEKKSADFRYNENSMISPYFRHYFTTNRNWNHFGEIFLGINSGERKVEIAGGNHVYTKYTDAALGVVVGTKYISNGGFVVGAYAGLGRNMFSSNSYAIVPRAGVNVGYRF